MHRKFLEMNSNIRNTFFSLNKGNSYSLIFFEKKVLISDFTFQMSSDTLKYHTYDSLSILQEKNDS